MIEFKNVTKMYTPTKGIKDISFVINDEVIGLIGPNGTGKTTFLELLQGFLVPQQGEVIINGVKTTTKEFNLSRISYTSANVNLPMNISVKSYINYLISVTLSPNFATRLAKLAQMVVFDLQDKAKIKSLSSGMVQKMKIITCLAEEKDIYIFDEPTRGLDPIAIEVFFGLIKKLRTANQTIVYCTHVLKELQDFADKVLVLKDNHIVKVIDPKHEHEDIVQEFKQFYNLELLEDF